MCFCETGVFTASESEQILRAALAHGLKVKIHTDEIDAIGGTELAGALSAVSAEHLIAATDRGIAALGKGGTVAVLLPFHLCPCYFEKSLNDIFIVAQ